MNRCSNIPLFILFVIILQACTGTGVAPVTQRGEVQETAPTSTERKSTPAKKEKSKAVAAKKPSSGYHIVEKGDTLYSIAWRYNFDYKKVADWNRIKSPYTIFPGQVIRLKPLPHKPAATPKKQVAEKKPVAKKPVEKKTPPVKKKTNTVAKKSKTVLPKGPVKWNWPTKGKLVKSNSPTSKKGIDISGSSGQIVKAAANGEVVYSGSGLLGYGKLIIIKHNETYLSAYAYNSKLLVKEGDRVIAGQHISKMGQDHTGRAVLHFEIRQNGKPVNPVKYLPKKRA